MFRPANIIAIIVLWVIASTAIAQVGTFPNADTAGITSAHCPNWGSPKTDSGGMTITTDGTLLEYQEITGTIRIKARNVTLRCVLIQQTGLYGIHCDSRDGGCPGLVAENIEISDCNSACVLPAGADGNPVTLRRMHLHDSQGDLLKATGNLILTDSYLHGFNPEPGAHNDAIQSSGGSNIVIRGNRIDGPPNAQTSAYIVKADFGIIDNVIIENNWLSGGTYTLYLRDGNNFPAPSNISVINNVWQADSWAFGPVSSDASAQSCLQWQGNQLSNGTPLDPPGFANPAGGCAIFDITGRLFSDGFE